MSPKTKRQLWIAGGTVGGALAVFGILALFGTSAKAKEKIAAPPATDADVDAVVRKALAVETDPAILRELATAMLVLPYSNPLRNQVGVLQARASSLEALKTNVGGTETFQHIRQF
jgi:hypothetical protein